MKLILLALALVMQTATPPPQQQPRLQDRPQAPQGPGTISPAHDLYFEDAERLSPVARAALHRFAGCVVEASPARASETLRADFTSAHYRNALRLLARNNEGCFQRRRVRSLHATGLPFAGALAEHLLARDPAPLNIRLARAAAAPALQPFSATDRMALCVVRSVPDEIGRLIATEVGSTDETEAAQALAVPVRVCSQGGPRIEAPPTALRAMLATAAFRTVAGPGNDRGSD